MKIAILGYDVEGRATYEYYAAQSGHEITICDQNPTLNAPAGATTRLGEGYLDNLDHFDLLVRTAGLQPAKILAKNPTVGPKITSQTNEFLRVCPTKNVIGVTGTKGKGTTATLIAKMLEADGRNAYLGGNIGIPALALLANNIQPDDWVVLELSSFQLIDARQSPHIAVCLMVVSEHLDWHANVEEYFTAKTQLFAHQTTADFAIYYADNPTSKRIASTGLAKKIPYFAAPGAQVVDKAINIGGRVICPTDELKLLGAHNWQNVCAAVTTIWQVSQNVDAMRSVLTSFSGLEHRLEFVREVDNVKFYDDSFGTTPETAIVAIQALAPPKVLILGGSTKGSDFSGLARAIAGSNIRQIILIGNTARPYHQAAAPEIEAALRAQGVGAITSLVRPGGNTMDEIVRAARAAAEPGDVVLLSPACASFDLFVDYKDRGEQFKKAVAVLA